MSITIFTVTTQSSSDLPTKQQSQTVVSRVSASPAATTNETSETDEMSASKSYHTLSRLIPTIHNTVKLVVTQFRTSSNATEKQESFSYSLIKPSSRYDGFEYTTFQRTSASRVTIYDKA